MGKTFEINGIVPRPSLMMGFALVALFFLLIFFPFGVLMCKSVM